MKRTFGWLAGALTFALVVAACGGGDDDSASNESASSRPTTTQEAPTTTAAAATTTTAAPPAAARDREDGERDAGDVLVDAAGKTLYAFANDQGTTSACTGGCARSGPRSWPRGRRPPVPGLTRQALGRLDRASRLQRPPALHVRQRTPPPATRTARASAASGTSSRRPATSSADPGRRRFSSRESRARARSRRRRRSTIPEIWSPAAASSRRDSVRSELRADLGAQLFTVGEAHVHPETIDRRPPAAPLGAKAHLDPFLDRDPSTRRARTRRRRSRRRARG